jgi:heat shock protein HslJ
MRVATVCLILAGLLVGCDDDLVGPSGITDVTWKLETIQSAALGAPTPVQVSNPDLYTLKLGNDGRASVRADCNTCTGPYTLDGSTMRMGPLACTLVGCPAGSLGTTYAQVLESRSSIEITDTHLVIRSEVATLRFRK